MNPAVGDQMTPSVMDMYNKTLGLLESLLAMSKDSKIEYAPTQSSV